VRARFAEDVVERAAAAGVSQYVILGAGLDSFAYRRHDLLDRLRVFEVDHPATQRWKRRRLTGLGVDSPAGLVFAPVDFERQTLRQGLEQAGFDFRQLVMFSWVGVTMYLTLDAISATLATMAGCRAGSRVVLTYNQPPAVLGGTTAQVAAAFAGIAAEMGEPFVSRFLPSQMDQLLREHGSARSPTSGRTRRGPATSRDAPMSTSPEPSGWLPPPSCQLAPPITSTRDNQPAEIATSSRQRAFTPSAGDA